MLHAIVALLLPAASSTTVDENTGRITQVNVDVDNANVIAERAVLACPYLEPSDSYVCEPTALATLTRERATVVEASPQLGFAMHRVEGNGCVVALRIDGAVGKDAVIDWSASALTIDGKAQRVLPSGTLRMHRDQTPTSLAVSAGARFTEVIVTPDVTDERPCIANTDATIQLKLHSKIDGADDVSTATFVVRHQRMTEAQAFALIPAPFVEAEPTAVEASGWWIAIGGASAVVLGCGACCAGCVAATRRDAETLAYSAGLAGFGVATIGGLAAVLGGAAAVNGQPKARDHELTTKQLAAYHRKRKALGLDGVRH